MQTRVTADGLNDFAARVKAGEVVPVIDHVETLWKPETLWAKRPSGNAVGKIVFAL